MFMLEQDDGLVWFLKSNDDVRELIFGRMCAIDLLVLGNTCVGMKMMCDEWIDDELWILRDGTFGLDHSHSAMMIARHRSARKSSPKKRSSILDRALTSLSMFQRFCRSDVPAVLGGCSMLVIGHCESSTWGAFLDAFSMSRLRCLDIVVPSISHLHGILVHSPTTIEELISHLDMKVRDPMVKVDVTLEHTFPRLKCLSITGDAMLNYIDFEKFPVIQCFNAITTNVDIFLDQTVPASLIDMDIKATSLDEAMTVMKKIPSIKSVSIVIPDHQATLNPRDVCETLSPYVSQYSIGTVQQSFRLRPCCYRNGHVVGTEVMMSCCELRCRANQCPGLLELPEDIVSLKFVFVDSNVAPHIGDLPRLESLVIDSSCECIVTGKLPSLRYVRFGRSLPGIINIADRLEHLSMCVNGMIVSVLGGVVFDALRTIEVTMDIDIEAIDENSQIILYLNAPALYRLKFDVVVHNETINYHSYHVRYDFLLYISNVRSLESISATISNGRPSLRHLAELIVHARTFEKLRTVTNDHNTTVLVNDGLKTNITFEQLSHKRRHHP